MDENREFYDRIARFYDAENAAMVEDLGLYEALAAQTGGPVLDVGCGTGRVLLHLAGAGLDVVGVDHSEAMLACARDKLKGMAGLRARVTLVAGDVLTAELPGPFGLVLLPYNGFMHFTRQANQLAALRRLRAVVKDGGRLALDLPNAGDAFATQDDSALVLERMFPNPAGAGLVMQQSVSELDRAGQLLYVTWIYDVVGKNGTVQRTVAPLVVRYVFAGEMDLLLKATGWEREAIYGDYEGGPFEDGSPRMIVVARPAGE